MSVNAQRNVTDETAPVQAQLKAAPAPATTVASPVAPLCPCFVCSHRKAIAIALAVVLALLALSRGKAGA